MGLNPNSGPPLYYSFKPLMLYLLTMFPIRLKVTNVWPWLFAKHPRVHIGNTNLSDQGWSQGHVQGSMFILFISQTHCRLSVLAVLMKKAQQL